LDLETRLIRNARILDAKLGNDELALLSTKSSRYYGLDGPGARIWEFLETETSIQAICDCLLREFDVAPDICRRETREFLEELIKEELVSVVAKKA
jgi:hypothetical protein